MTQVKQKPQPGICFKLHQNYHKMGKCA